MIALGTLTCSYCSDTYDLGGCLAVSFFQEILFVTEVMIIIHGNMYKSDDHPKEDLAKSGCKPEIKCKYLIIPLYFGLHDESQV
jgi:hypothetical protein